jgi:cell division protein ZapA (FtsZ GTPase activity inhibitor)
MKKEPLNLGKWGLIILIFGIIFTIISPALFTLTIYFNDSTGHIASTVGGLTAPAIGLMGAILVYLALRSQVRANELIQEQIRDQKEGEIKQKNFVNLLEIYKQIKEDFDKFTVTKKEPVGVVSDAGGMRDDFELITHSGRRALFHLYEDLVRDNCIGLKENKKLYDSPAFRTILHSLKIFGLLTEKINNEELSDKDKDTLGQLSKYFFASRIETILRDECPICKGDHDLLPQELSKVIEAIKTNLTSL